MNFNIKDMKSAKEQIAAKLEKAGISTTGALLKSGLTPDARKALAEKIGSTPEVLLTYINRADLSRVKGIGPVYSDLLEYAGVDTVVELSKRVPENLHAKLTEMADTHQTKRKPRLDEVQSWVAQAKNLDRRISY
jgi:predicted flap endonuclease-1-like 5' DNA nuclease